MGEEGGTVAQLFTLKLIDFILDFVLMFACFYDVQLHVVGLLKSEKYGKQQRLFC